VEERLTAEVLKICFEITAAKQAPRVGARAYTLKKLRQ
jgi:hypothetical protein